ncbi:SRPBCC family protein [uncultured Jatrophihabitans sp.]|uniref:SRPBCC family protein n=1 Tax=uncultured Jatrophihabitans sp. TaxID=1610747 RepID=UPI0035C9CAB0
MTRWYPLEPTDAEFFTTAQQVHRYQLHLDAPPGTVWESLASDRSMADWGPAVKTVTWLTPRPFGVDTEREVVLAGGLARVRERFTRWDEGRGYSFSAYEASFPMLRRFAEDYVLEPDGDGTLFTWVVAIEPKPKFAVPVRVLGPVNKVVFGRMAADGRKLFAHAR